MSIYTDVRVKQLDKIVVDLEKRISALERAADNQDQPDNCTPQPDKKRKVKKWTRENSVL